MIARNRLRTVAPSPIGRATFRRSGPPAGRRASAGRARWQRRGRSTTVRRRTCTTFFSPTKARH